MPGRPLPVVPSGTSDAAPAPFPRIGIVGLGLIGGSLALACRQRWPQSLVIGVDRNDVIERATVRHAIDVAADDLGMLVDADLVVLAAPVETNRTLLARLDEYVTGEAIVTDVGSSKRAIVEAARTLPSRLTFVGGHPFAGAARAGIEHAAPELFQRRPWFLTPDPATDPAAVERLAGFVRAVGAEPRMLDADAHDRLLAALSHLPQVAASVLMQVVGERAGEDGLALAGRGLRDTTRLASSPGHVWADVCRSNADYIGEALDALIAALADVRARLDLSDSDDLEDVFGGAQRWRGVLDRGAD